MCDYYFVLFDESLNDYFQQKQMDIHIRYWDASHKVATRYFTSVFMGHSKASPAREGRSAVNGWTECELEGFQACTRTPAAEFQVRCLDLSNCGLHTVHNVYKAGIAASKWGLDFLLSSLNTLFHDAPTRREDFTTVTGQTVFPHKFVAHRWVENIPVIERTLLLWFALKKYLESAKKKEVNLPKCASCQCLSDFCADSLVLTKLNFALGVAMMLQPFLVAYQTDRPLLFFLSKDLEGAVRKLVTKFVKCSVLCSSKGITGMLKIDMDDPKNHIPLEKVDVGHEAKQILKSSEVSAKDTFTVRMQCKEFLVAVTKKILEKSTLRLPLVRGLASLDPRQMFSKPDECLEGFKKVLNSLTATKRISDHQRDTILAQYAKLLQEQRHDLQQFERTSSSNSFGKFFYDPLKISSSYSELCKVL